MNLKLQMSCAGKAEPRVGDGLGVQNGGRKQQDGHFRSDFLQESFLQFLSSGLFSCGLAPRDDGDQMDPVSDSVATALTQRLRADSPSGCASGNRLLKVPPFSSLSCLRGTQFRHQDAVSAKTQEFCFTKGPRSHLLEAAVSHRAVESSPSCL